MGKRAELTRAGATMSEAAFWSMIRSCLRQKSRWWKPIAAAKAKAKRPYKGTNKRQKFEYKCNHCKKWFTDKQVRVDHIKPVGTLKSAKDLPDFVENLFCEIENFQVLCSPCHDKKTKQDRVNISASSS